MPNPFEDGGSTKTMDLPPARVDDAPAPEAPRGWLRHLIVAVLVVLALLVVVAVLR